MLWLVAVGLAIVVFLAILNGHLHGIKTAQVDAALGVLWVALLIAAFVGFGWLIGVLSIVGSFVFGAIMTPVAAYTARRLLGR